MCCGSGGGGYPVTTAKYEGHTAASFQYSLSSFGSLIQRHAISDTAHTVGGTTEQWKYYAKQRNSLTFNP
jgi:hypothetical protein